MSRSKGFAAEGAAATWLARQGYEIIERNYCEKFGEIDIIAAKAGVI
ncbi:MAG: YraN family protein, partial [Helicobacteraceae bacterium]|nr:YraN family protein [Helicobacteraceae bacterium]